MYYFNIEKEDLQKIFNNCLVRLQTNKYLNIDDEKLYELFKKIVYEYDKKNFNNYDELINAINVKFNKSIENFISNSLDNSDYQYNTIDKFINRSFKKGESLNELEKSFYKLHKFVSQFEEKLSYEVLINLYKNNTLLKECINTYAQSKNIEDIYDITDNDLLISFVDIYKDLNNIEEKIDISDLVSVSNDSVKMYLNSIPKRIDYTLDEEIEFIKKAQANDKYYKNLMVENNLKLVVSVAKKYIKSGISFLDLIQEGNIGLMVAIDKFDISKKTKFSTYATYWIRQRMSRYIDNNGRTVRLPVHMHITSNQINRTINELTYKLGHEPSTKEIAFEMDLKEDALIKIMNSMQNTTSLNKVINDDKDTELRDMIDSNTKALDQDLIAEDVKSNIMRIINENFSGMDKEVIIKRFGFDTGYPKTLEKIGKEYNLTRERIRQIEKKALKKLGSPRLSRELATLTDGPEAALESKEKSTNNINDEEPIVKIKKRKKNAQSIYEVLPNYEKDIVDKSVLALNQDERDLLYLKYGSNLDKLQDLSKLSMSEKNKINCTIIPKVKRICKSMLVSNQRKSSHVITKRLPIYQSLEEYPNYKIDLALNKLTKNEMDFLTYVYGSDFKNPTYRTLTKEENEKFRKIINKVRDKLSGNKKTNNNEDNVRTIYSLICEDKDLVDLAISHLPEDDKNIIYKRYGNDLSNLITGSLDKNEESIFRTRIIPRIKRMIDSYKTSGDLSFNKRKNLPLLRQYKNVDSSLIFNIVDSLSEEEKELLYRKYGENLSEDTGEIFNAKDNSKVYWILKKVKNKIDKSLNLISLYEYCDIDKETLLKLISTYSKTDQDIIYKKNGDNLENINNSKLTDEENEIYRSKILPKIKRHISNYKKYGTFNIKDTSNIIDTFEGNKEDLLEIIEDFSDDQKELLYRRHGKKLDEVKDADFSDKERYRYYVVLKKIRKKINNPIKIQNLYEFYNVDADTLINIISKYPKEEQDIIYKKNGANLENINNCKLVGEEYKIYYNKILPKLRKTLKRLKQKPIKAKCFYDHFDEDKKLIDEIILKFPEDQKDILYKKYGNDLSVINDGVLTKEESVTLYSVIFPKIKRHISNYKKYGTFNIKDTSNIIDTFEGNKEDLLEIIEDFSDDQKELLYRRHGKKLDEVKDADFSDKERYRYYAVLKKIHKNLNNKLNQPVYSDNIIIEKNDSLNLSSIINNQCFNNLPINLSNIERIILSLRLGLISNKDKNFTADEISKILNVDKNFVIDITIKFLKCYKEYINNKIDDEIKEINEERLIKTLKNEDY